jgi:hypothetical protein
MWSHENDNNNNDISNYTAMINTVCTVFKCINIEENKNI